MGDDSGRDLHLPPAGDSWPDATIEVVDGCDHFLAGAIGRITTRAIEWLTA